MFWRCGSLSSKKTLKMSSPTYTSNRYVYHHKMNGSASIKSVLPALFPELDYSKLNISNGGTASLAYLNLSCLTDKKQTASIREDLLEYCKRDTDAMVKLYGYLNNLTCSCAKVIPMWQMAH